MMNLCAEKKITLVAGTVAEPGPDGKIFNTCPVVGPDGGILAAYRKIHLFDIFIADGADHQESKVVEPGDAVVTVDTPAGRLGLSVCYDLRFPELYRRMALDGARILFVPAAFTMHTGKDHWIPLLQARAIENLAYVAAPAQFGRHSDQRQSYGKSLIADPWGAVIARAPDRECFVIADIDFDAQDLCRKQMPCLEHARPWLLNG
jgi:predicted amidohydrolase